MRLTKLFNRAISMLLVFIMVLSIVPLNIFQQTGDSLIAYGDPYTGTGGGHTNMTGGGAWRANWTTDKQGVRFTIVDQDMNIVLKNHDAVDITFSNPNIFGDDIKYLKGTKFQEADVDNDIYWLPIGGLQNAMKYAIENPESPDYEFLAHLRGTLETAYSDYPNGIKTMPQPILQSGGKPATGNGDAVKAFFIDGALGSYTQSGYALGINKVNIPGYTAVANPNTGADEGSSSTGSSNSSTNSNKADIKEVFIV